MVCDAFLTIVTWLLGPFKHDYNIHTEINPIPNNILDNIVYEHKNIVLSDQPVNHKSDLNDIKIWQFGLILLQNHLLLSQGSQFANFLQVILLDRFKLLLDDLLSIS